MTKKQLKTKSGTRGNAPRPRAQPKKKKTPKQQNPRRRGVLALAKMIADPCNAPLVRGCLPDGEGAVERVRTQSVLHTTAAKNNGYIVWFPQYHNAGTSAAGNGFNLFSFEDATITTQPTNTIAAPFSGSTTGVNLYADPSNSWVARTTVQDARTIAACLKFYYIGSLSATQGQVAVLENVPLTAMLTGSNSGVARIDHLMNYATKKFRTPTEPVEVRWSPSTANSSWHGPGKPDVAAGLNVEHGYTIGTTGATTTLATGGTATDSIRGIGFAWSNFNNLQASDVVVDATKIFEWRPSPYSGFVEETADTESASNTAIEDALSVIRRGIGNAWQFVVTNPGLVADTLAAVYGGQPRAGRLLMN